MFNKNLLKKLFVALLVIVLVLVRQEAGFMSICGTTLSPEQINYELQHVVAQSPTLQKLDYKTTLAIKVYILSNSEGVNAISEDQAQEAVQKINQDFAPINLGFEICNITYINSDKLYAYDIAEEALLSNYLQANVINLFFVHDIVLSEPGNTCGYTYYPIHKKDFIILKGECCINNSTMSHEMGHFLGLYHTHEHGFGQELVDQSNCYKAGDLLCDTPADPGLHGVMIDENCNWSGRFLDRNKQLFKPDLANYMSYGRNECRNKFSKDQYNKMLEMYCNFKIHLQQLDVKFKMSDSLVFPNEAVTLSASGGSGYKWSNGDSSRTTVIYPTSDTVISLTLSRPGNCTINHNFPIRVIPDSYLSGDDEVCYGGKVEVHVNSSRKGATYQLRQNDKKVGPIIEGNGGTITLTSNKLYTKTTFTVIACNSFQECDFVLSDRHTVNVASIPDNVGVVYTVKANLSTDSSTYLAVKNSNKNCYYEMVIAEENQGSRLKGTGKTLYFPIPVMTENTLIGMEVSTSCRKKRLDKTFLITPPTKATPEIFSDSTKAE